MCPFKTSVEILRLEFTDTASKIRGTNLGIKKKSVTRELDLAIESNKS